MNKITESPFDDDILAAFCGRKNSVCIADFLSPFSDSNRVYASDTGALCFRALRYDEFINWSCDKNNPAKSAADVAKAYGVDVGSKFDSALPKLDLRMCSSCQGCGFIYTKTTCVYCSGTGLCECDSCGTEHDCGYCDGSGYYDADVDADVDCDECQGTGVIHFGETKKYIRVYGVAFQRRYVYAISRIPDMMCRVIVCGGRDRQGILFAGGGYAGVALSVYGFDDSEVVNS
jgi:hypothetical protein